MFHLAIHTNLVSLLSFLPFSALFPLPMSQKDAEFCLSVHNVYLDGGDAVRLHPDMGDPIAGFIIGGQFLACGRHRPENYDLHKLF
jgi:hypothetical protein